MKKSCSFCHDIAHDWKEAGYSLVKAKNQRVAGEHALWFCNLSHLYQWIEEQPETKARKQAIEIYLARRVLEKAGLVEHEQTEQERWENEHRIYSEETLH